VQGFFLRVMLWRSRKRQSELRLVRMRRLRSSAIVSSRVRSGCLDRMLRCNSGTSMGFPQLIVAQNPIEPPDNGVSRFKNAMLLCALEESRCHAILMHRVDFVIVENSPAYGIEEPRPLPLRALPFNQLPSIRVCNLDGAIIAHQFAISITGERQIGLSCERSKPAARTRGRVEK